MVSAVALSIQISSPQKMNEKETIFSLTWSGHVWPIPDSLNKVSVGTDTDPTARTGAFVNQRHKESRGVCNSSPASTKIVCSLKYTRIVLLLLLCVFPH